MRAVWFGFAAFAVLAGQTLAEETSPPSAGTVLGAEIRTADAEELRYEVLRRLTDRYAEAQSIVVSESEKKDYVESVRVGLAAGVAKQRARREEITRQLATPALSAADRKSLEDELVAVDGMLEALAEPSTPSAEEQAAREEIAAAFIRQWKIHRALYRQYGGRIGYQQGGAEPLDAVRMFLEERQQAGDFTIADPRLEEAFWSYYRNDAIHDFMPAGSADEAQAFAMPPWAPRGSALAGTLWRLVEIQSMDDAIGTTRVDDPSLYTLAFGDDGRVAMRLGCNRGTGPFEAQGGADSGSLKIGPMAVTRALCPPPSLDERIAKDMDFVRSYLVRDGRLALSLEADAAIYFWEPDSGGEAAKD